MTILALTTMLVGVMLGLRFKVLILAPAIFLSLASNLSIGIAHNSGAWSTLLVVVVAITVLQVGYLCGSTITDARIRKIAPGTTPAIQKPSLRTSASTIIKTRYFDYHQNSLL